MCYEDWLASNWPPFKKQLDSKKLEKKFEYKVETEEKLDSEKKRVLEVRDNMTNQIIQYRLDEIDKGLIKSLTPQQLLMNDKVKDLVESLRFYADGMNYSLDDYYGVSGEMRNRVVLYGDATEINDVYSHAGRRAREALKKFEGKV